MFNTRQHLKWLAALFLSIVFVTGVGMSLHSVRLAQAARNARLAEVNIFTGVNPTPVLTLTGNAGGDRLGWPVASAGDVNKDGYVDLIIGAWGYNALQGQAYVYLGAANGANATPAVTLTGTTIGDRFGSSVAGVGDVNKDGYADVMIGAYHYGGWQGQAYLHLGNASGITATPAQVLTGYANSSFGISVAGAGDVNKDGYSDVVIGSSGYNNSQGQVYVYLGAASGLAAVPVVTLTGITSGDFFGWSTAGAGDVNKDGYADVVIGASGYNSSRGQVYVYLGNASGVTATPAITLTGQTTSENFGYPVAGAGDVNKDGYADVVIGASGYNSGKGRAFVYLGHASGLKITPALTVTGGISSSQLGRSVAGAGDLNHDGYADLVIGDPGYHSGKGQAYVYLGSVSGLTTPPALTLSGEAPGNSFGWSVASAGDVNKDTYADLVIGAYGYNNSSNNGRVYLYLGRDALHVYLPVSLKNL